uniref:CCAAT enhancer binding protein zeta n=1 Tax=Stegastes partitus TaxID=144197 RepID=A0A3B5BHS7_9TELE
MAAKNKHRKKSKKTNEVTFQAEDNEPEAENGGGGEEDEDLGGGEGQGKANGDDEEFSLEEVLRLGGTRADFVFLAGLNDTQELVDGGKKGAIDDLEEGELQQFITKLGIQAYSGQQIVTDEPESSAAAAAAAGGEKESKKAKAKKVSAEEQSTSAQPKVSEQKKTEQKTTKDVQVSAKKKIKLNTNVFEFQQRQVLLIKPGGKWFELEYSAEGSMAAMTVLIQDKKGSRRMGLMAMDTLREKLRTFAQHPFDELEEKASGNRDARDRRLILWYFEHQLKHHVAEFVVALDSMAHDTVAATKAKALATAHELLCSRPEQEKALLIQVVNKLGDPEYKTAAKASYLLETLLHKHPNMKVVVCCEVERLMFRPNISPKAQYYAICFLSQVMLSHDETELATKLITVYFSFFRACVKKKDIESKMLSALLSGVNRAYPYASAVDDKVKEQLDTLFKVVHLVKFNTAVQALMLLFQVMDSQQSVSDRYYVTLYR